MEALSAGEDVSGRRHNGLSMLWAYWGIENGGVLNPKTPIMLTQNDPLWPRSAGIPLYFVE
jgi:hypothetical protein